MNYEIKYTEGEQIKAENFKKLNEYLSDQKSKIDNYKDKWD